MVTSGPAAITLPGTIARMTAAASHMSPFSRGYRRMPGGSIVWGVAPDPGSWHFALMAIMWQGFRGFLPTHPGSTRGEDKRGHSATGSLARWQPRVDSPA